MDGRLGVGLGVEEALLCRLGCTYILLNCGVGEDSLESLGLQESQPVHPKGDQS